MKAPENIKPNRIKIRSAMPTRLVTIYSLNQAKGDGVMLFRESETIELKETVVDDIKKREH